MKELSAILAYLTSPGATDSVLATLVSVEGSSYRRPGARLLMTTAGERIGSISGGCLEEDVLERARGVLASGYAERVVYDTTSENDLVWGVGLGCHGIVHVVLEKVAPQTAWISALAANLRARQPTRLAVAWEGPTGTDLGTRLATEAQPRPGAKLFEQTIFPPTSLVVFGAGDDARPLLRLAKELGWHLTVADPRPAFCTAARFPSADRLVVAPAAELVDKVSPEPAALAVVMTHHYVHDRPLIGALLPRPLAYLGLLGPRKRAEKILGDLAREGVSIPTAARSRLHAPVGLDLGADSPEEVALAILAEMQASLTARDARPLRERTRPIHE
jgi:xanthine dehydrogenase accessory factor